MKKTFKILALLLSLSLICALAVPACASPAAAETSVTLFARSDGSFELRPFFGGNASERPITATGGAGGLFQSADARTFSQVGDGLFLELGRLTLDILNLPVLEALVAQYGLAAQTAERLYALHHEALGKRQEIFSVELYTPNVLPAWATRSYTGYGGQQYFEDIIFISSATKNPAEVFTGKKEAMNAHIRQLTTNTLCFLTGAMIDYFSSGAYSLFAYGISLIPASVPTGAVCAHTAKLYSERYEKMTRILVGAEARMGSTTTSGDYYFNDYLHAGFGVADESRITERTSFATPHYASADQLAYEQWSFGGILEQVASVEHFFVSFSVT